MFDHSTVADAQQNDIKKIRLVMALRHAGVHESRVLAAIEKTARDVFVPQMLHDKAYDDIALSIGCGQTISQPSIVGMMTQYLEVNERHKVLEIGTGSGYQAAILAKLCRRLYTIERQRPLFEETNKLLTHLLLTNVTTKCGDGFLGWAEQKPFDRIIVTAACVKEVPPLLVDQLSVSGIMIIPIGDRAGDQMLTKITKNDDGQIRMEELFAVRFVPMLAGIEKGLQV